MRPMKRFAARLRAGSHAERAVLLNLQEEDRVPDRKKKAFHAALAGSKRRSWEARFKEAAKAAPLALPVPAPRRASIAGAWCTHVGLTTLQKHKYLARSSTKGARPPLRLSLTRPIGRTKEGTDVLFWITNATSKSADEIRDRLGLCFVKRGETLYRIGVDAARGRPLYIPTALDAGFYPAWRRPASAHTHPWGMTRHLATDAPSEPELLALPDAADDRQAHHVGLVRTDPPDGYLAARGIP
jgi:hypothetical protein